MQQMLVQASSGAEISNSQVNTRRHQQNARRGERTHLVGGTQDMMILTCTVCGYQRRKDSDGRRMIEDTIEPGALVCETCNFYETAIADVLATGETTLFGFKISYNE
jgi:hypothetical protein